MPEIITANLQPPSKGLSKFKHEILESRRDRFPGGVGQVGASLGRIVGLVNHQYSSDDSYAAELAKIYEEAETKLDQVIANTQAAIDLNTQQLNQTLAPIEKTNARVGARVNASNKAIAERTDASQAAIVQRNDDQRDGILARLSRRGR